VASATPRPRAAPAGDVRPTFTEGTAILATMLPFTADADEPLKLQCSQ